MSRLIGLVVIVLLVVGVIGYYQGWLDVSKNDSGGTTNVSVAIDKDKMKEAPEKAAEKIKDAGRQLKEKVTGQPNSGD